MKKDLILHAVKMFFIVYSMLMFTLHAYGQVKEEKKAPLKGLGSKLKEKTIPAVLGPKASGKKNNNSKEKQSESEEEKGENDPEEVKFDEDEDDPDKMMEKMIRQLGHDPEKVKHMMNEEAAVADPKDELLLGNLGQAWPSLGQVAKAKPLLQQANVPKSTDPNDSGLDIRQAASIGASKENEMSIVSGFRGEGPKVSTVGNIFNRSI